MEKKSWLEAFDMWSEKFQKALALVHYIGEIVETNETEEARLRHLQLMRAALAELHALTDPAVLDKPFPISVPNYE
jgi:hypothetical protein